MLVDELKTLTEIQDLRSIWGHEALDFTPWLAKEENLKLLGDTLDMDLELESQEADVGDFKADIVATDNDTNRTVIIENLLEETNHDHLGKLITYAAGKDASAVIWLVKNARPEHRAAITWLNEHTSTDIGFFLCEIKVYRIGKSAPAVKFDVVEMPNDWTRISRSTNTLTPIRKMLLDFWTEFYEYAFSNADNTFTKEFKRHKPAPVIYNEFYIGNKNALLVTRIPSTKKQIIVELSIPYANENDVYNYLYANKDNIEQQIGKLTWLEQPNKKASRIFTIFDADANDRTDHKRQFDWIMKKLLTMKRVMLSYLQGSDA